MELPALDREAAPTDGLPGRYGPVALLLAATTLYAVLRYNVFQGVPWSQLPLLVLNKSIAWTSVLLLAGSAWRALRPLPGRLAARRAVQGGAFAAVHVLASLLLQGPASYPALFGPDARPTLRAGAALLAGILAASALLGAPRSGLRGTFLPVLVAVHVAALGAPGWVQPEGWPGHLVPISLLSFLAALALLGLRLVALRRAP